MPSAACEFGLPSRRAELSTGLPRVALRMGPWRQQFGSLLAEKYGPLHSASADRAAVEGRVHAGAVPSRALVQFHSRSASSSPPSCGWRRESGTTSSFSFTGTLRRLPSSPWCWCAGGANYRRTVDRFGFDVELLFVAYRAGLRLTEIPVRWNHCDESKVSVGRHAVRMLAEIRQIRIQAARGVYARAIREASATAVRAERRLTVAFAR